MTKKITEHICLPFIRTNSKKTIGLIGAGVLVNSVTLLLPLSIGKYLQLISAGGDGKAKALQLLGLSLPDNLSGFFVFFLVLIFIKFLCTWFYNFQLVILGEKFVSQLRVTLYTHQLKQAQQKKMPASVLLAYSNEAKALQRFLTKGIIGFAKDVLFLLMALYLLCIISFSVTLFVFSSIILFFICYRLLARRQKGYAAQKNRSQTSLINHVSVSVLQGQKIKEGVAGFLQKTNQYIAVATSSQLRITFMNALAPAMLYSMLGASMFFIAFGYKGVTIDKTYILTYLLLLLSISPVVRKIIKIESIWGRGRQAVSRYTKMTSKVQSPEEFILMANIGANLTSPKEDIIIS